MKPFCSILLPALSLLLLAGACEKAAESLPVLTFSNAMLPFEGGSQFVTVAADGDWSLSLDHAGAEGGWARFNKMAGTGETSLVFTADRNDGAAARSVTVVLATASHTVRRTVQQACRNRIDMPGWLELPALDRDDLFFGTHDMSGGRYVNAAQSGTRNWSFYYDEAAFESVWVAYPLNTNLIGRGSRSNEWGLDPLLPASRQPDLVDRSYGGGWTRGHQLPSADRLAPYSANVSTFYGTNMTPQDYDFNTYIWARLEGQVRTYAGRADTLYVATGADFRAPRTWSGSNAGKPVPIPTHYFKALLRKSGDSYSAAGFLLPHDTSIAGGNHMNYLLSIDDLEERTGIDFFANLPSLLGEEEAARIEAADPAAVVATW